MQSARIARPKTRYILVTSKTKNHFTASDVTFQRKKKKRVLKLLFKSGLQSNFRTLIRQDFPSLFSNLLANIARDRFEKLACTLLYSAPENCQVRFENEGFGTL